MPDRTLVILAATLVEIAGCREPGPQAIAVPIAELDKPGTMTVTGTATLEISPDRADLEMTISVDGARPGVAAETVQKKQQQLVAALLAIGVEHRDLKLSYLSLHPVYSRDDGPLRLAAYRAEVTVTATTSQFDKLGPMMEVGANAGATAMSSQFRRSDLPDLKKQVRDMAIRAAKDKAAQTAKGLGFDLGRVVSVVESANGVLWSSHLFPNYVGNATGARSSNNDPSLGGALQPLTLDITVGFALANKT